MAKHVFKQLPGVYKMLNTQSKNIYIGSTNNISKRIGTHKYSLKNKCHDNIRIMQDLEKYGFESFEFEVLKYLSANINLKDRLELEQFYFEKFNPYYNIWPQIYSANNRKYTVEQLNKLQEKLKNVRDNFNKEAISTKMHIAWQRRRNTLSGQNTLLMLNRTGKKASLELREKLSKQRKGKPKSQEFKDKLRKFRLGTKWDNINKKWVRCSNGI
jgi:group I intron endonuclease